MAQEKITILVNFKEDSSTSAFTARCLLRPQWDKNGDKNVMGIVTKSSLVSRLNAPSLQEYKWIELAQEIPQ